MQVLEMALAGTFVFTPRVHEDSRGYFFEVYRKSTLLEFGIEADFVQENQSRSQRNVLRGLHYQIRRTQGKLVRVVAGEIFDVVVDLRRSSATFGKWVGARLSAANRKLLWAPPGLAHGFLVLSDYAEVLYKTTDYYAPEHERCIRWNDPTLAIAWPIESDPMLSGKDALGLSLHEAECFE